MSTYSNPAQDCEEPLLGDSTTPAPADVHGSEILIFNSEPRPYRDTKCASLFIATLLITYAFGFLAVKNADFDLQSKLRISTYNPNSGLCEVLRYASNTSTHNIGLALQGEWPSESSLGDVDPGPNFNVAILLVPIVGTSLLVTPVGFFIVWILCRYTRQAVVASIWLPSFIILAVAFLYTSTFCLFLSVDKCSSTPSALIPADPVSLIPLFPIFIFAVSTVVGPIWRLAKQLRRAHVVTQILKSSLQAVTQNLSVFLLNPVLSWVVILIDAPIITFVVYASNLGKISPDFVVIKSSPDGCGGTTGPPCCQIEPALQWIVAYSILAGVAAMWVVIVAIYFHRFVASGAIAEWYAAKPAGSSTVGFTKRSLRNALGPSFGTICCSASLMTPLLTILHCITPNWASFTGLFHLVEPFSSDGRQDPCVVAAISGESFFDSARISFDLLRLRSQPTLDDLEDHKLVYQTIYMLANVFSLPHHVTIFLAVYYLTTAGGGISFFAAVLCTYTLQIGLLLFQSVISEGMTTASYCSSDHNDF